MKPLWIIGVGIVLGGCALPQAETVASTTADTSAALMLVSAAPSSGDHRLSSVRLSECAPVRVRHGLAVCGSDVPAVQSSAAAETPALAPEHPQEIVGTEAHRQVLDGAS